MVADQRLAGAMSSVQVHDEVSIRPHRMVSVLLQPEVHAGYVKKLRKPMPFPAVRPIGPQRCPPDWEPCLALCQNVGDQDALDKACGAWMEVYEGEMAWIFDIQGEAKYLGRADEPTFAGDQAGAGQCGVLQGSGLLAVACRQICGVAAPQRSQQP